MISSIHFIKWLYCIFILCFILNFCNISEFKFPWKLERLSHPRFGYFTRRFNNRSYMHETSQAKKRRKDKKKKKEAFLPVTFFCDAMKYLSRLRCFSNLLTGFVTFLETGSHLYSIKNWNKITFLLRKSSFKNSRNRNQFFLFLTTTYIHYCLCLLSNLLKVRKWLVDLTRLCL